MLSLGIRKAICKVLVTAQNGEESHGTGFLVGVPVARLVAGQLYVLTARHVVKQAKKIVLMFDGHAPCTARLHPCSTKAASDWALLECAWAGNAPGPLVRLQKLWPNGYDVSWDSFGWPRLYGPDGGAVGGVVRLETEETIDTHAREFTDEDPNLVKGISGAPCAAQGGAVGLVSATLDAAGRVLGSTLRMLPAQLIVRESSGFLELSDNFPLPYESYFRGALSHLPNSVLVDAAVLLKLGTSDEFGQLPSEVAAVRVARGMLGSGLQTTIGVLEKLRSNIDDKPANELLQLAESLWVEQAAADRLSEIASLPSPRAAAINARRQATGLDYLSRASSVLQPKGFPPWPARTVFVTPSKQEPVGESTCELLAQELKRILPRRTLKQIKEAIDKSAEAYTAVIADGAPTTDIVAAVGKEFPKLHLVFLTHPTSRSEVLTLLPGVHYVEPELSHGDEDLAHETRLFSYDERARRGDSSVPEPAEVSE